MTLNWVTEFAPLEVPLGEQALMVGWCEGGPLPELAPVHKLGEPLVFVADPYVHYALTRYEAVQHLLEWVDDYRTGRGWA